MNTKKSIIRYLGKPNRFDERIVYIRVSISSVKIDINTGVKVLDKNWNANKSEPKNPLLRQIVAEQYLNLQKLLFQVGNEGKDINWFKNHIGSKPSILFLDAAMAHVDKLRNENKYGNANTYKNAINHLERVWPGLELSQYTQDKAWQFLKVKKDLSNNGIRHYVKMLRALFNVFIRNGQIIDNPFGDKKMLPPYTVTRKRNITIDEVMKVYACDTVYTDIFYLMFLLRGIDLVDLLNLTHSNLDSGYLFYFRDKLEHKTHELQVKVFPEAMKLLDKYKGQDMLLEFLSSPKGSGLDTFKRYRTKVKEINNGLDVTKEVLGKKVTTKFARHSFATVGKQLGYSKDLVGEMLGHSGRTITDVYLDRFDQHIVDDAHINIIGKT